MRTTAHMRCLMADHTKQILASKAAPGAKSLNLDIVPEYSALERSNQSS
jgi:hypothetical protein